MNIPTHPAKRLLNASLLLVLAGTAQARNVDYVDVTKGDGIYLNHGRVEVSVINGEYAQVSSGNTVPFHMRMKAGCKSGDVIKSAFVSYGQENVSGGILEASPNYKVTLNPPANKTMSYTPAEMQVPLNRLGVDPVQMCRDGLQAKMAQGMSKLQVMNSDQTFGQVVTFTGVAGCGKSNKSGQDFDKDTYADQLTVVCKAGPVAPGGGTVQAPKLPITAVPLGGNGQVQLGANPLNITEGEIMAGGMQHYVGTCPAQLSMAVKLKGSGKGKVRVHVVDGSDKIWESVPLDYDGTQGYKQMNFFYNLPALPAYMNTQKQRSFRLFVELKDENANSFTWSPKGDLDTFAWSHTCKPALNVPLGQGGGQGGVQFAPQPQDNGPGAVMVKPVAPGKPLTPVAPASVPQVKTPVPAKPATPALPNGSLQAVPIKPIPRPAPQVAPPSTGTEPKALLLPAVQKAQESEDGR